MVSPTHSSSVKSLPKQKNTTFCNKHQKSFIEGLNFITQNQNRNINLNSEEENVEDKVPKQFGMPFEIDLESSNEIVKSIELIGNSYTIVKISYPSYVNNVNVSVEGNANLDFYVSSRIFSVCYLNDLNNI